MMKLLSLFSGIGAFEKALENLNIDFELVNFCEIDKYASKSYSIIHNVSEDKNLIDVTKVDTSKLPNDIDLVTYGFPCVPKGYMIKVENGYKAIEDITNSDLVLTHTNTYKKVVKTMSRVSDHINHIKLVGCQDLQLTDEHPLYVLRNGEFTWVKAKDLNAETDYLCYNINNKAIPCEYSDDVLWLMGRYFADGYKENHSLHRPIFCIGKDKIEEFETYIKLFKFSIAHGERSAVEYKITDDYLCEIFSSLTTGSTTKEIPQWIVDLPKQQLEMFYKGYFSGDGHSRKDRELYMFCTTSKNMFLALQDIVIKLYNVVPTVSIRHDNRKATYNDTYNAQYSYRPKDQIVKDNKVCVKIKDVIRELKDIEVFNFEVEEDNSYTVNNVIVHNCQDISQAGKQQGFINANGVVTRSGLFFEALRIIKDTKPKYAIAENVKALTSKKFTEEFMTVLSSLKDAGYHNYFKVLNAKDFGIPQNRERVFIVSIREDIDDGFVFPDKEPLLLRLKDMLQDNVDEKYYLNDSQIKRIKDTTYNQGKRRIQEKDYCDTLCARDYKDPQCVRVFDLCDTDKNNHQDESVGSRLDTIQGGNSQPFIIDDTQKFNGTGIYKDYAPTLRAARYGLKVTERMTKQAFETLNENTCNDKDVINPFNKKVINDGVIPTLTTRPEGFKTANLIVEKTDKTICLNSKGGRNGVDGLQPSVQDRVYSVDGIATTCTTSYQTNIAEPTDRILQVGNIVDTGNFDNPQRGRIYSQEGISPILNTVGGDGLEPKIIDLINYRIRKLTPTECWRLMGFTDEDINKCIAAGISKSQLYKQAGNSICVPCLEKIFTNLLK